MRRLLVILALLIALPGSSAQAQFSGGGGGPTQAAPLSAVEIGNNALNVANAAYAQRDFATAAAQYAAGCDAGNATACGKLGEMFVRGEGVKANSARAAGPLAKACDGGVAASCGMLAQMFDRGDGVGVNKTRAFALYQTACAGSNVAACYGLGRLYDTGQGTLSNLAQAAAFYQKACGAGHADGCTAVAGMYAAGRYFAQNSSQAEAFYKLACSKGAEVGCRESAAIANARSRQAELIAIRAAKFKPALKRNSANCRAAKELPDSELESTERLARSSLPSNDPVCVAVLGWVYYQKGDYEMSFAYHDNAAAHKYAYSIREIGAFYANGVYVSRDYDAATLWYQKARAQYAIDGDDASVQEINTWIKNIQIARNPPIRSRERVCRTVCSGTSNNPDGSGGCYMINECY